MCSLPLGLFIVYGIVCLMFDNLYFSINVAIILIVIESVYDLVMKILKREESCDDI